MCGLIHWQVRGGDERPQLQRDLAFHRGGRHLGARGVQEAQQSLPAEPSSSGAGVI